MGFQANKIWVVIKIFNIEHDKFWIKYKLSLVSIATVTVLTIEPTVSKKKVIKDNWPVFPDLKFLKNWIN